MKLNKHTNRKGIHDTGTEAMIRQIHLFMQEHEKRKPWRDIIPSKYQLTTIYTKCWLLLSHWDESNLLSYHICIKSQQLMSRITNVKGHKTNTYRYSHSLTSPTDVSQLSFILSLKNCIMRTNVQQNTVAYVSTFQYSLVNNVFIATVYDR